MFKPFPRTALRTIQRTLPARTPRAFFTTTPVIKMEAKKVEEYKSAGNRDNAPPKHEGVYFKGLMSEKRAFGDFRTVLHTGLYAQIVAMEVPVGGEIGDEVRLATFESMKKHRNSRAKCVIVAYCQLHILFYKDRYSTGTNLPNPTGPHC